MDPNNAIFEGDETNNTVTETTTVSTGIDLTIAKTRRRFDPIATSGTQTYTITVDNIGPQDAINIRVRDTLPSGTIFRDVIGRQRLHLRSLPAGIVECVGGSIRGTASEFYPPIALGDDTRHDQDPHLRAVFEGTMHNEVRVDPLNEIAEINETNNFAVAGHVVSNGGAIRARSTS